MDTGDTTPRQGFIAEISQELRDTLGRSGAVGGVLPPIAFFGLQPWLGVAGAATVSLVVAGLTIWVRAARGASLRFAVSGATGAALAALFALRDDTSGSYFLPGIVSGAATTALLLVSIALGRPVVALASWATRGWPLEWYRHPSVRPAYVGATWLWVFFFGLRTLWQWILFLDENSTGLLLTRVVGGWPATAALLIGTYALGRRRLLPLAGPSVDEFTSGVPSPWVGQQRGF
jgi:hypothetical protein